MKIIVEWTMQSLNSILEAQHQNRINRVKEFQNKIWNDESMQNESLDELLSEIAYDLDFYEPNEHLRKECLSYYDDDILEEKLKYFIDRLKSLVLTKEHSSG